MYLKLFNVIRSSGWNRSDLREMTDRLLLPLIDCNFEEFSIHVAKVFNLYYKLNLYYFFLFYKLF
jgi:hypothetical protein